MKGLMKMAVVVACMTVFQACGVDTEKIPAAPTTPVGGINFTAHAAGSAPSVTLQKGVVSGSTVYVNIVVNGVSNLYGANLRLIYDETRVRWGGSYQRGAVLEPKGTVNYLAQLFGGVEGTLIVGASLQGGVSPVATATGILVSVPFTSIAAGTSNIDFALVDLRDNLDAPVTVSSTAGGTFTGI